MADVHEIRGASVTARGSAPVHRDSPFRWLTHPRRDEFTPSRKRGANRPVVWASATLRRIASGPADPPRCIPHLHPRTDSSTPAIPLEEFIREALLAGQSAPKSAELRDKSPRTVPPRVLQPPVYDSVSRYTSLSLSLFPFFPPKAQCRTELIPECFAGTRRIW